MKSKAQSNGGKVAHRDGAPQKKNPFGGEMTLQDPFWWKRSCPTRLIAFNEIPGSWQKVIGPDGKIYLKWTKPIKQSSILGGS